jgi:hypothetical protein
MRLLAVTLLFPLGLLGCSNGGPDVPSGSLTVEVSRLDPGAGDYTVDIEPDPGPVGMVTRIENGYRYAQVAEGEYTVTASQGERSASEYVLVERDEDNHVEVKLPPVNGAALQSAGPRATAASPTGAASR